MQAKQTTGATVQDCHLSVPRLYDDDRARRACDVFGFVPGGINMGGDLNVNWIYPGRIIAWHRHHRQTDNWFVVRGHIKVGLMDDDRNVRWVYLGENDRRLLSIPPGIWHGLMALGEQEAVMIYYITSKYDEENPDEERLSVEEAGVDWTPPIK